MRRYLCVSLLAVSIVLFTPALAEKAKPESATPIKSTANKTAEMKSEKAPYTVANGTEVDEVTLAGWRTWRGLACERCHGAEQEGSVGPSLVESLKVLTKEDFHTVMMEGRIDKGMPPFNTSQMMQKNWEGLYAYLKGRSDGKIKPGRLTAIAKQ